MIRYLFVVTLIAMAFTANSQSKVTLNGYIKDSSNGEVLIGVTVYFPELKAGTTSNAYGFYSITIPSGTYEVQYSYLGYKLQSIQMDLGQDTHKDLELETEATVMSEICGANSRTLGRMMAI